MVAVGGAINGSTGSKSRKRIVQSLIVGDPHEKQALCRCCWSGLATVFGIENAKYVVLGPKAAANVDQCARYGTHHIVQETIGLYVDPDPIPGPVEAQMSDGPNARPPIGPAGFETMEVVPSDQWFGRTTHGGNVEPAAAEMRVPSHKHITDGTVVNDIPVQLAPCVSVGVEFLQDVLGMTNDHVVRQVRVNCADEGFRSIGAIAMEIYHLPDSMDTGIRPTAGVDANGVVQKGGDRLFENFLNSSKARLCLPAVEIGPVVAQRQLEVAQAITERSICAYK
jgi:hypothetical protein